MSAKNGFDQAMNGSGIGFLIIVGLVLFVIFPPILLAFVVIGCLALIFKYADWRDDRKRRKSRES